MTPAGTAARNLRLVSPPARKPDGRDLRRAEIADQMLGPVEELLAEGGGFTELTVGEIVERAGVKRSTFYYHFKDKAELLIEISARAINEIVEASYGLYELDETATRRQFEGRIRRTVETWLPHVPLMRALAELAAYDPRVREQFEAGWAAAVQGIHDHIVAGQKAGFVRKECDPVYTAGWLTWMAERGMSQVAATAPEQDLGRVVKSISAIVWRTLYDRD